MSKAKRKSLANLELVADNIENQPVARVDSEVRLKQTTFRVPQPAKKQLDFMTVELERKQNDLLLEALNDLFVKYGKPPIA